MNIFEREIAIRDCDCASNRLLRPSSLFSMIQEIAIDHSEEIGAGRSVTFDRGFLWVLARQKAEIVRLPEYGEHVIFQTWPGSTMHFLFPRYYRMLDHNGESLLSASSLWTLIHAKKRSVISPQKEGIVVTGETTGYEIALPSGIRKCFGEETCTLTVPYSYTDINGHMNNIFYLDVAENMIPEMAGKLALKEISVEYSHEILCGETMTVSLHRSDQVCIFSGDGEKHYFSLLLRYE